MSLGKLLIEQLGEEFKIDTIRVNKVKVENETMLHITINRVDGSKSTFELPMPQNRDYTNIVSLIGRIMRYYR